MCLLLSNCDRDQGVKNTSEEYKRMTVLAFGKNWKFNTTVISASKNRPLFFSKSKLVQNIGRCGSSRLPAAQLRKPHDKANLKRKKCVCLLKASQGKKELGFLEFFSLYGEFVVGEHPSGLDFFPEKPPNGKCERPHLSIHPC